MESMPARCVHIRRCRAWGRRKRSCLTSSKLCMRKCSKSTLKSQTIPVRVRAHACARTHVLLGQSFHQICRLLCVCMSHVPPSLCARFLCACDDADEMARVFLLAVGGLIKSWAPSDPTDAADVVRFSPSLPPSLSFSLSLSPSLPFSPSLSLSLPPSLNLSLSLSLSHGLEPRIRSTARNYVYYNCRTCDCIVVSPMSLCPLCL